MISWPRHLFLPLSTGSASSGYQCTFRNQSWRIDELLKRLLNKAAANFGGGPAIDSTLGKLFNHIDGLPGQRYLELVARR